MTPLKWNKLIKQLGIFEAGDTFFQAIHLIFCIYSLNFQGVYMISHLMLEIMLAKLVQKLRMVLQFVHEADGLCAFFRWSVFRGWCGYTPEN